jgi:hypothetical protein
MRSTAALRLIQGAITPTRALLGIYILLFAVLAGRFAEYLRYAIEAVGYPYELDYGEGIVWQQALLIPGARMYGDITQFPFIVFHYPPVFHLLVRMLSVGGSDMLAIGRGVSLASTIAVAGLAGAIAHDTVRDTAGRVAAWAGGIIAGAAVFCSWPVVVWSPLMRVDMLALALTMTGLWLAGRPAQLVPAVLCFVAALYTKQTGIAAPLAVLVVGLVSNPRATLRAYGIGGAAGLLILILLETATGGGFLRHVISYNLNRFSLEVAISGVADAWRHGLFLLLALGGLWVAWSHLSANNERFPGGPLTWLRTDLPTRRLVNLSLYFALAILMLTTIGKSGAAQNYLIETLVICSILSGLLVGLLLRPVLAAGSMRADQTLRQNATLAPGTVSLLLLAQISVLPVSRVIEDAKPVRFAALETLRGMISRMAGPVLSDDMVLLLRAGKSVVWEPAIFAELAETGRWDERQLVAMIHARKFAAVITRGASGSRPHDSRFTAAVNEAITAAYHPAGVFADRTLHLP